MIQRILALLLLSWAAAFMWFATTLPSPTGPSTTDAIVVVTGSAGRIERGVALLSSNRARKLLISGVNRDTGRRLIGKTYGIPKRLMRCCVDLGYEAIDTRSNAIETTSWIEAHNYRSVRLITSDWHMRRAAYELRKQLPGDVAVVEDAVPTQPSLAMLLREFHKYALRRLIGLMGL